VQEEKNMIKITVTLAFGQEDKKRKLDDAEIWNDASGILGLGHTVQLLRQSRRIFQAEVLGNSKDKNFPSVVLLSVMKNSFASPEKSFEDGQLED